MLRGGLGYSSLGRRVQHVLNGRNASDRLLRKNAQLQRQCAREFSVEIDRAAAHSCDNPSVLNFRSLQLHKDDGLLGAEKILQNADHFEVELFHLIAGKNRVSVSLHACAYLAERKDFVRFLGAGGVRSQAQCPRERQECEEQQATELGQMRLGRIHESVMIRGRVPGSNRTRDTRKIGRFS